MGSPVFLSSATSLPDGQLQACRIASFLFAGAADSRVSCQVPPLGRQKRAEAHNDSASARSMPGPSHTAGLLGIRYAAGLLGAVKADAGMPAVAIRFGLRPTAAAQSTLLPGRIPFALDPPLRFSLSAGLCDLLAQRQSARHEIRAVSRNDYLALLGGDQPSQTAPARGRERPGLPSATAGSPVPVTGLLFSMH